MGSGIVHRETADEQERILPGIISGEYSLRCLKCRYDLRGLAGEVKVCPECGTRNSVTPDTVTELDIRREYNYLREQARRYSISVFVGMIVIALSVVVFIPMMVIQEAMVLLISFVILIVCVIISEYVKLLKEELGCEGFHDVLFCFRTVRVGCYVLLLLLLFLCGVSFYRNLVAYEGFPRFALWVIIPVIVLCFVYGWKRLVSPRKRMSAEMLESLLWERSAERARRQKWKRVRLRIDWSTVPKEMKNCGNE